MRHTGTINYWYGKSGQGFIKSPTIRKDVWIHYSTAPNGIRLRRGMEIEFDMVASARGPQAANVKIVGEGAAVKHVPRHLREAREREQELGLDPVAWSTSSDDPTKTSPWHFIDPVFPEHTLCGLSIPKDKVVEGGANPINCKICHGRAKQRQKELTNGS